MLLQQQHFLPALAAVSAPAPVAAAKPLFPALKSALKKPKTALTTLLPKLNPKEIILLNAFLTRFSPLKTQPTTLNPKSTTAPKKSFYWI